MGLQRTSNTTRPGTNRKRRLIGASLIGTGGVVFATAMPAAANNNESSASCSGVIGKATNFHAGDTNMLILSIDGAVVFSAAFTQNIEHVADVPQDGNTHTWQAAIDSSDNRWDSTVGGTVGPCGGGPPAHASVDDPAADNPAGHDPSGHDPAGYESPPDNPSGHDPAADDPAADNPAGHESPPDDPAGHDPAGHESPDDDAGLTVLGGDDNHAPRR